MKVLEDSGILYVIDQMIFSYITKTEKKAKLLYKKLNDIRSNHLHQTTNAIIKQLPNRIVLEDLNVKGMMKNRHLSKAIGECSFYEFRRQIESLFAASTPDLNHIQQRIDFTR
jgi:IS605 OrfB family transposase